MALGIVQQQWSPKDDVFRENKKGVAEKKIHADSGPQKHQSQAPGFSK